jgi:glycosyltransferase involved in cell wall biosynthesis
LKLLESDRLAVFGRFLGGTFYPRTDAVLTELSALFDSREDIVPVRDVVEVDHHKRIIGIRGLLGLAWTIILDVLSLLRQSTRLRDVDVVYLPYPAYTNLAILQLATLGLSRKPLIIDAFLCLHDTVVSDRKLVPEGSVRSRLVAWVEYRTLARADAVLIDTAQQRDQLVAHYGLPPEKFIVTPVGIDEGLWQVIPPAPAGTRFNVLFWGTFIPLHGVSIIIAAAALLEEAFPSVEFILVGDGQEGESIARQLSEKPLSNVVWHRRLLPAPELYELVTNAHCVLGIFGDSLKAASVVPYKVYQAFAANRLLITRRGPAMEDLLEGEDAGGVELVAPGDPEALSEAIRDCFTGYSARVSGLTNRHIYDNKLSRRRLRNALREGLQL